MILSHVVNGLFTKMNRTKQVPSDVMETPLNRCLNTFDITLLGKPECISNGHIHIRHTIILYLCYRIHLFVNLVFMLSYHELCNILISNFTVNVHVH